jgi:hypothetical protein
MHNTLLVSVVAVLVIAGGAYFAFAKPQSPGPVINQSQVTSGENPEPGSAVHDLPVEPAADAARKDLAAKLSVDEKSIVILQIEEKTWNDGCLGVGGAAESCLQALVEGFRVEMFAEGKTYFYRTDKTGVSLRAEGQYAPV